MRKILTCIMSFILTKPAFAQDPEWKKIVAIQQAQISSLRDELKQSGFLVGSVHQSLLTAAQFGKLMGKGWVLCDGRDISEEYPDSKWHEVTRTTKIPDCRGRFLRSVGGNAAGLGEVQDDTSSSRGLSVSSSTFLESTLKVSVTGTLEGTLDTRGHSDLSGKPVFWGGGSSNGLTLQTLNSSGGVHEIFPRVSGSMSGTASGGSFKTDSQVKSVHAESRPVNLTVNTFIKVD